MFASRRKRGLLLANKQGDAMSMIPDNPERLLTRRETATALSEAGYPTSSATLATKATRGGGPPFVKFGARALYRWADALSWARQRTSEPYNSTSEHRSYGA